MQLTTLQETGGEKKREREREPQTERKTERNKMKRIAESTASLVGLGKAVKAKSAN